ncbi:recombination protein NinB [Mycetohabitans sp. B8]|uniref:recombination protein NinB n=1 Tax=Mycetohabitans sp. B8 TaxID=2841845 RepID=UPI001F401409|nr:recombination protein NinB [Mycetohabitans sp. B8]MCG1042520.1 recombination protein NinB [Mycetohabitans sp. B8]
MNDDRQLYRLVHLTARQLASRACINAPHGYVCEIRPRTRSLEANAKMWALLADVARQVHWHGERLTAEEWKDVFTAGLKKQKVVPGIDGGFVVIGARTRAMTVREMSDVIELIYAFGVEHGVKWSAPAWDMGASA